MSEMRGIGENLRRFVGFALVAAGILWIAVSGLCAVALITSWMSEMALNDELGIWIAGVLIISGVSAALGYVVYILGRALRSS